MAWILRLLAGLTAICAVAGSEAAAARDRSPSSKYYEWQTESDWPAHGYSGWVGGGRRGLYCDYQRLPNRECKQLPGGRQKCRATSWTLKQYCY
jgi:hypothetical protein